ncbi:SDR family NAD(P)-dependent oxidoreductase [Candidatus Woesearchaeota archaeon]|nr:SDR family NAD(P)-dependent oxidoreductase [Candidatus Woesearchaeota archaeon]
MKKILVTGAAGFIGSHTCEELLRRDYQVIGVDNFNDYYDPEIKKRNIKNIGNNKNFKIYNEDIRNFSNIKNIFEKEDIDKVIHLAARAGVRPSLKKPRLYFDVNVNGTLNLLELAKKFKINNFIFGSSSSVYGENKKIPFSEKHRTDNQISPYASSKKAGELLCKTYSHLYSLNITCLRFFTVYGERGRPDMAPYKFTNLIYNDKPIEMYGNGTSKRDYTYIKDIVSGILTALEKNFRFEIINLGNSDPVKLKRFISIIEKKLNKKAKIIQKPIPKGDVKITYADISKAKRLLAFEPKVKIDQGLSNLIDWYKLIHNPKNYLSETSKKNKIK